MTTPFVRPRPVCASRPFGQPRPQAVTTPFSQSKQRPNLKVFIPSVAPLTDDTAVDKPSPNSYGEDVLTPLFNKRTFRYPTTTS